MTDKVGRFQVPFLVDANTGVELFEGAEIVKYLETVYIVKGWQIFCSIQPLCTTRVKSYQSLQIFRSY